MRIPRVYTDQPLTRDLEVTLEPSAASHLVQVLRLRPGMQLILFNGTGKDYPAQLSETSKKQAVARVLEATEAEPYPALEIHLGIGISKGERMDFAIQKAVELGISEITPLFTKHGVVRLKGERLERRIQHWRQVVISACEQSGRRRIPALQHTASIDRWLSPQTDSLDIILDHRATTCMGELEPPCGKIRLLVGPEGGLNDAEHQLAKSAGFSPISLGPRILRTETAPLAAIAAIQMLWGDFRKSIN